MSSSAVALPRHLFLDRFAASIDRWPLEGLGGCCRDHTVVQLRSSDFPGTDGNILLPSTIDWPTCDIRLPTTVLRQKKQLRSISHKQDSNRASDPQSSLAMTATAAAIPREVRDETTNTEDTSAGKKLFKKATTGMMKGGREVALGTSRLGSLRKRSVQTQGPSRPSSRLSMFVERLNVGTGSQGREPQRCSMDFWET